MSLGRIRIKWISADIPGALCAMEDAGFLIRKIRHIDTLTIVFTVERNQLRGICNLAQRRGDQIQLRGQHGLYFGMRRLFRRPILVFSVLFLLFLTWFIPTRIWFVRVEGNHSISTKEIISAAENAGIGFGVNVREVRSERMKNRLLAQIPQLQWAGINTGGCVAIISVREGPIQQESKTEYKVSSLLAACDGTITSMTVTAGNGLCKVGQGVKAGQVLISGYTDCGIVIQATKAAGEIFADTQHIFSAITPTKYTTKHDISSQSVRYQLLIGKKLINLTKGSGISGAECDRIKLVNYITLPGGFQLPLAIVKETVISYQTDIAEISHSQAQQLLRKSASHYLMQQMVAGRVDREDVSVKSTPQTFVLQGIYYCNEMIARTRTEEIIQKHE